MFQRIVDLCRSLTHRPNQPTPPGEIVQDDRRAWDRYPSSAEVSVQAAEEGGGTRQTAAVRDVSRGGIKLIVRNVYAAGDMVRVDLPGGTPGATDSILACVIQVRAESNDSWAIGCVFCEELNDDELGAFGASRVKAPSGDKRNFVRFPCSVKATYERVDDPENSNVEAEVDNVSATGIGLLLDRPLELGSLLNLHLRNPSRTETRTILACVVHVSTRPGGKCLLGCNFIRELDTNDLKALF
jgi:hypothetical protein